MGIFKELCSINLVAGLALAVAVPFNGADLEKRDSTCGDGPGWALPQLFIGGDTSGAQCETQFGHDYSPVRAMEVWRNGNHHQDWIAGLQFTYASGVRSQIYGHEDTSKYPSAVLNLAAGEQITNAILYGDGRGEWLGHISIETSKGNKFEAGKDTNGITPYGVNVGSGLLLGADVTTAQPNSKSPADIRNLALLFLAEPIDHITIQDINFTEQTAGSSLGINAQNIVVGEWFNHFNNTGTYGLSPVYAVTSSYSHSQTTISSYGSSFSIEVSDTLFGIGVKNTDTFTWGLSDETATTTATSSATSIACAASGTLAPNQGVKVTGSYQTGQATWSYNSLVVVYLKDGTNYQYNEQGQLTDVAYNECTTTWENANDPSITNSPGFSLVKNGPLPTRAPALP